MITSREEAKEIIDACWGKTCYRVIPPCDGYSCPYNGGYGGDRCSGKPNSCKAFVKPFIFDEKCSVLGFGETWFDYEPDAQAVADKLNGKEEEGVKELSLDEWQEEHKKVSDRISDVIDRFLFEGELPGGRKNDKL